mgnify:FL=1
MKELCYERIRVVKGVRKRQLVRIYYVASKKIFSQVRLQFRNLRRTPSLVTLFVQLL